MFFKGEMLNTFNSFLQVFDPLAQQVVTAVELGLYQHGHGLNFREIEFHLSEIAVQLLDEISNDTQQDAGDRAEDDLYA